MSKQLISWSLPVAADISQMLHMFLGFDVRKTAKCYPYGFRNMRGAAARCQKTNNPRHSKLGRIINQLGVMHSWAIRNVYHLIVQARDISIILFGRLDKNGGNSLANAAKRLV